MLRVLGTLWSSLGAYYYEIFPWTAMNLLWFAGAVLLPTLGISIFPHAPYLPTVLIIVLLAAAAPPSVAALYYVARRLEDGENVGIGDFFRGFRLLFWRSWQLGAVDLVIGVLLAVNIWFYGTRGSSFLKLFDILWLYALAFWFLMQPFLFGLLVFQQDRRLRNTIRNAFLVVLDNIGTSLSMLIVGIVFIVLSVGLGLPILAFSGIVGAVWSTRVLDGILAKYPNTRQRSEEKEEQHDELADVGRTNALPVSPEAQRRSILARQRSRRS